MALVKHGITENTPKSILLGAGTYYKGLTYTAGSNGAAGTWNGTCLGSTQGGGKISIEGEYLDLELDGALVRCAGLTIKQGGTATMEISMAELTADALTLGAHMKKESTSNATGYDLYVDKPDLEAGDYVENLAFVGKMASGGKNIIVIFEKALCKSAFELEAKHKENAVVKLTFEAYAGISGDLDTLPVKIYYPTATA
jgi:hypothetical protein